MEGLIFGGAYLLREICVSKSSGLALQLEGNLPFLLCFTLYLRAISEYKPLGSYIWRGDLTDSFLRYKFAGAYIWRLIHEGAYIWRGVYMEGLNFGILRYVSDCPINPIKYQSGV